MMISSKKINQICFKNFLKELKQVKTHKELVILSNKVENSEFLGVFKKDAQKMLKNEFIKYRLKKNYISCCIPKHQQSFKFNLKDLDKIENKINKINNSKLKFEFEGLFNLLNDKLNLTYNPLCVRKQIIKDLNKFKSLRFFKVNYISRYDLKNEYKYLSYKNNSIKGYSKIHFIRSGLYVIKTLNHDDITLKVFYIGKKYKTLLKSPNKCKKVLKGDKFNLSSVNAYKTLDKRDSMRYYSYCNDMGLNKSNRDLLRSIRSKRGRKSFYQLLEDTEDRIDILNDKIYQYYNSNDEPFPISDLVHYEWELKELEENLYDWTHENNSYAPETELGDYLW